MKLIRKAKIHGENGFTLLESTLVIIVIGMLAVISIPKILSTNRRVAEITTQQMTSDMRIARTMAITNSMGYIVKLYQSIIDGTEYGSYGIFPDADGDGVLDATPEEEGSPVKVRDIPEEEIDCTAVSGSGFSGTIYFNALGRIDTNFSPFTQEDIIHITDGEHDHYISATVATGRVYFD